MARDHARINLTIWTDPDFRALPPAAQHLYLTLWTAPELSYCGVHDWRPARMTGLSSGFTAEHIETVAACLEARHFFVIDRDTEECLIRSWARFDGLMKQPRMAVSLVNAYASVGSQTIRKVLVHEVAKIREESPSLSCWNDKRVAEMLDHPSISAKDLPPASDPFGGAFAPGLDMGLPQTQGKVWGSVCTPSTPAPATTPNSSAPRASSDDVETKPKSAGRKRPATRIPDDWKPTEQHWEKRHDGIDVEREAQSFRLHAEANDRRQVNWSAAFSQWLLNARPSQPTPATQSTRLKSVHDLEQPPSGLTDEEYLQWDHDRRQRQGRA